MKASGFAGGIVTFKAAISADVRVGTSIKDWIWL
jgi:hypothetical protein